MTKDQFSKYNCLWFFLAAQNYYLFNAVDYGLADGYTGSNHLPMVKLFLANLTYGI